MTGFFPASALRVQRRLADAGYKAYFVGGCVRDALLGKRPKDFDLATSALPQTVSVLFTDGKVIPTGIKHGTVTVITDDVAVEVTTFRRESTYNDHRHPDSVAFTDSVTEDAARRDFTVNAIYYDPFSGLVDPYGGEEDLHRKVLRCVGNAERRFNEDALRILRGLRFAATLGFELDGETVAAAQSCSHLLKTVAAERVLAELKGFFSSDTCAALCIKHLSLFAPLFGSSACAPERYSLLALQKSGFRLPAFFALYGGGNGAVPLIKTLKPDKRTLTAVAAAADVYADKLADVDGIIKAVTSYGVPLYGAMLTFAESLGHSVCAKGSDIYARLRANALPCTVSALAVTGNELIAIGFKRGKKLGEVLRYLFRQTYLGLPNEKAALLAAAEEYLITKGN